MPKVARRTLPSLVAAAAVVAMPHAAAQHFPTKALRIVVAAAPGGANDVLGRMYAQRMNESLGQSVIIDNRAGGGGIIGAETVAHAAPDGYTLLYSTNSVVVNPSLFPKVGYSMRDLAPISLVSSFPIAVTVHPSVPVKTLADMIALSKRRGGLNYGSSGTGSTNHLTGVLLNNVAGIANVHIPYKGAGPMMTALLGGEIEMGVTSVFSAVQHVRSGRLRALAVTSLKPLASLPGVPTVASSFPGFDTSLWHGYFTTAGTPPAVIAILHRELVKALRSPNIQQALQDGAAETVGNTPEEFAKVVAEDTVKYAKLVKMSGAKAD
jgi:tripartite-type tricarboxylate transporter receptor subunit TctC